MVTEDRYRIWIKRALFVFIPLAVLFIGWQTIFKRPFVNIVVPEGADTVELRQLTEGYKPATVVSVTKSGSHRLPTGDYSITYVKDKRAVGFTQKSIKPALKQSISTTLSAPTNKMSTFMHDHAKLVTPFSGGYLFVDTQTQGISYTSSAGTADVSASFLLSQSPQNPDDPNNDYNTVINIQNTKDGDVVVTTTAAIFLAKSPTDITRLRSYDKEFLNFTSSSYDAKTNRVFALSAYKKEVFYYDLSNIKQGPKVLFTAEKLINRVNAGGGKVAVYFDDVPSIEPEVLKAYALLRQLAPVVIDGNTGKKDKTLDDWQGTTMLTISADGTYAALKKKYATTMSVIELSGSKSITTVAPDAGAIAWQGSKLLFGRDKGLWSIDPATGTDVTYVAPADETFTALIAQGDTVIATTNNNYVEKLVSSDVDVENQTTEKMKALALETDGYFITYTQLDGPIDVTVETKGSFSLGTDEASLAASQAPEYQKAVAVLQGTPGLTIHKKDTSIVLTYQYAGIPADGDIGDD